MSWDHIKPLMETLANLPHPSGKTVFEILLFLGIVLIYKPSQHKTQMIMCQQYTKVMKIGPG